MKMRKRIVLMIAVLLIAAGCAYGADRIANKHFNSYDAKEDAATVFTGDQDIIGISGCEVNDGAVTVTGPDPQFVVSADNQEISRVHIVFAEAVSSNTFLQIFYAPVGAGFSEGNSVVRNIRAGSQDEVFQIPKTAYSALRFDFEQNVNLDKICAWRDEPIIIEDRVDIVRFIAVFCIIFIPLCVLILTRRKSGEEDEERCGSRKPQ